MSQSLVMPSSTAPNLYCPFTIRKLNSSAYLIREHDAYEEYPHIYAKICTSKSSSVIFLSDTGVGTNIPNPHYSRSSSTDAQPEFWNIRTFLEHTINPAGRIPYLVITTHCHYDHILGIKHLPPTSPPSTYTGCNQSSAKTLPTTVLSSSYSKNFLIPYSNLQTHSICVSLGLRAPTYDITWVGDLEHVTYQHPNGTRIATDIQVLHMPGHTPDSIAWYDPSARLICVGDSLYETESAETREAPWGKEPRAAVILVKESDLEVWWKSLQRVLGFVRERNEELESEADDEDDISPERDGRGWAWSRPARQNGVGSQSLPKYALESVTESGSELGTGLDEEEWLNLVVVTPNLKSRLKLCASHVTASTDAESCLLDMQNFVARILRNEVPCKRLSDVRGEETWFWDDELDVIGGEESRRAGDRKSGRFSLVSPLRIIEEGRRTNSCGRWGETV